MTANSKNGAPTAYDSPYIPTINEPRKRTNTKSLAAFLFVMTVHIMIAIYAFSNGNVEDFLSYISKSDIYLFNNLVKFRESQSLISTCFALSVLSTVVFIFFARYISKLLIKIVFACELMLLIVNVYYLLMWYADHESFFVKETASTVSFAFVTIMKIYIISKVGIDLTVEIIKESCRAIFATPLVFLLSIVINFLAIKIVIFTTSVSVCLFTIDMGEEQSLLLLFFQAVNAYSGLWLLLFILYFYHSVLYGTFSHWYWSTNKTTATHTNIFKNFGVISKYHLGTIAYGTSIWGLFAMISTFIKGLINNTSKSRENIFVLLTCRCTIFSKLNDNSIGVSALHGQSFKKSAKVACDTLLRHPLRFFATIAGSGTVLSAAMFFVGTIILLFSIFVVNDYDDEYNFLTYVFCFYLLMSPAAFLLNTAVNGIFFCITEDYERNEGNAVGFSFMNAKLKHLMSINL